MCMVFLCANLSTLFWEHFFFSKPQFLQLKARTVVTNGQQSSTADPGYCFFPRNFYSSIQVALDLGQSQGISWDLTIRFLHNPNYAINFRELNPLNLISNYNTLMCVIQWVQKIQFPGGPQITVKHSISRLNMVFHAKFTGTSRYFTRMIFQGPSQKIVKCIFCGGIPLNHG